MEGLLQDVGRALRMFRKNTGFTAMAIGATAIGIGVCTAVFSVANAILLAPLPVPEPERTVFVMHTENGRPVTAMASPAHFEHWRRQTDVFEDIAAWRIVSLVYGDGDIPESVTAAAVSEAYFRVLGATILAGRALLPDEDVPGAQRSVIVSHGFWTRRLNGDPDALGKTIRLDGAAHTVVGITGPDFDVRELTLREPRRPDVWVPLQLSPNTSDTTASLDVVARLEDGVALDDAQRRIGASINEFRERFPEPGDESYGFTVLPIRDAIVRDARPTLYLLGAAVGVVLLIACANVASLMLMRAAGRERDVAIRSALGAARWRIARQLLVESVVLAVAAGALGLFAGFVGIQWLLSMDTAGLPRLGESAGLVVIDWRVVAFALGLSVATGIVFGLAPAFATIRRDLSRTMQDSSHRSGRGVRERRAQSTLVMVQVGLAVALLVGAGLLIRTSVALGAVELGFATNNVRTMQTSMALPRFMSAAEVARTSDSALARIRALPAVEAAASSWGLPLEGGIFLPFEVVRRENAGPATGGAVAVPTSAGYFATFDIPVLVGRAFDERDGVGAPPVVVINEALARRYWQDGSSPLLDRIGIDSLQIPAAADEPVRQVIGIVGNVRHQGVMSDSGPAMYFPQAQVSDRLNEAIASSLPMTWSVRTSADTAALSAAVQQTLAEETGRPVTDIRSMEDIRRHSVARQRLNTWLMTIFGGAALLLGAVGIYGVMAYSVQARSFEIGIRMAVGAKPAAVRNMIIGEGMLLLLIGGVAGLVGAYSFAGVLASALFGVDPHDVAVFVTVPVVMAAVGFVAVSRPAFRASRVDPKESLRYS